MYNSPPSPSSLQSIRTPSPEQELKYFLWHTRLTCRPKEVKEIKAVRFRLPTPPPDNPEEPMNESPPPQRDENKDDGIRRSRRILNIVKPTDEKEETFTFGSAVTWGAEQLRLLNVSVIKEPLYDLDAMVFRPQESVLPPEFEERTCGCSQMLIL